MRVQQIVALCLLSSAIAVGVWQQFTGPARAAVPIVRASYQGLGSAVNENVAVIWLLGSDGGLKMCMHAATTVNADAPICSAAATP